jgi:signal transduction histidine kinase
MPVLLRRSLLAMLLLVASQMVFWAMVTFAERLARPDNLEARASVAFQVLDADGVPVPGGDNLVARYDGTSGYWTDEIPDGVTDVFSVTFELTDKKQQLALFMAMREELREVKVNGITVQPDVPLQDLQGAVTSEPAYFLLPANALQLGTNLLTISKDHAGITSDLSEFTVGPATTLARAYRWKTRLLVDIPLAGVAILAFTIALCLAVNWPAAERARVGWLMGLLGSCMALTFVMSFLPQSRSLAVTVGQLAAFQFAIGITMAKYVAHDVGSPPHVHRWLNRAAVAVAGVFAVVYAITVLSDGWWGINLPSTFHNSLRFVALICVPCIVALCWACVARGGERLLERLILVICLTTFAVDRISSSVDIYSPIDPSLPISLYWSPIVGPLLGMGMILSLARQASEARRTVVQSNQILAARLAEQDAELARSYDAQKQMLQRQTMLEERQRIVRDMHDGIGGQLLGLLMQVRSGGAEAPVVEQGLQASMADLRLIVDSMDSADGSLAETLRSFEHRARPQVEAAGLAFTVDHGLPEDQPGPGPRPTLQILRVLQEALTNAVRHSGGSTVSLVSAVEPDGTLRIALSDDGRGLPAEIKGGRGLASMRSRAAGVGGTLDVQTSAKGTTLVLTLPDPAA